MFATLALILVSFVPQDAPKTDAEKLKTALDNAKVCAQATVDGDFDKVLDMTNPVALKQGGGKEKMLKLVGEAMTQMKKQGFKVNETKVEPAKALSKSGKTLYCVLPTTTVMTIQDRKVTAKGFLLGASDDNGKTWTYLDGSSGEPAVRTLLPDIPKDLKFPAKEAPKIEKPEAAKSGE